MGNRASISFKNGSEESVTLFSHWDGTELWRSAWDYVSKLKSDKGVKESYPLARLEPHTVMVDFIRDYTKGMSRVDSNYYLGKDDNDGDNSDNGHQVIDLGVQSD